VFDRCPGSSGEGTANEPLDLVLDRDLAPQCMDQRTCLRIAGELVEFGQATPAG